MNARLQIIGLMSGTSMDGLDIAHVELTYDDSKGDNYKLLNYQTFPFPLELKNQIQVAAHSTIQVVTQLDTQLGYFFANCVNEFIDFFSIDAKKIHAIGCHGQTILHQPDLGYTLQIGNGNILAHQTGIDVVNDFRSHDVCAGGQGAPLVPIGDFGLFHHLAEAFLNIGGFANLSYRDQYNEIRAFDICPANLPLNKLSEILGFPYDKDGELTKQGELNFFLLDLLNSLPYYDLSAPKSLGTEWLEKHFYPLIKFDHNTENNLRTVTEHVAVQIAKQLELTSAKNILVTGGGAKHSFLIARIEHYFKGKLILPDHAIIDYKEAIIFAYLAGLKLQGRINSLSSVTGARRDMCGGVIHNPGFV